MSDIIICYCQTSFYIDPHCFWNTYTWKNYRRRINHVICILMALSLPIHCLLLSLVSRTMNFIYTVFNDRYCIDPWRREEEVMRACWLKHENYVESATSEYVFFFLSKCPSRQALSPIYDNLRVIAVQFIHIQFLPKMRKSPEFLFYYIKLLFFFLLEISFFFFFLYFNKKLLVFEVVIWWILSVVLFPIYICNIISAETSICRIWKIFLIANSLHVSLM